MLGIYDYTVILTYMSAISAGIGIVVSLNGNGHPYMGLIFLLICGFCDCFDGKVARTKKNRTDCEKRFGIQIDSFSDLIAFGILPICIGNAMIRVSPMLNEVPRFSQQSTLEWSLTILLWAIMLFFMMAALIRLAHFNVSEEDRQQQEAEPRKYFEGLPVTSAALIFPSVMLLQYITSADITIFYFIAMLITSILFISRFSIPKPRKWGIIIMMLIGIAEFVLLILGITI